jgi:tRNA (cytidine/uridine-2'-O-)-methyltransferase
MIKKLTVALYEPEIPQNVGTIARTCACLDIHLVLIEPLGFIIEDRAFKRSRLDYEASTDILPSFQTFITQYHGVRKILFSPHVQLSMDDIEFQTGDVLLFGRESSGVEDFVAQECDAIVSIPMEPRARSLNLAMSVAMASYQAYKQIKANPTKEHENIYLYK